MAGMESHEHQQAAGIAALVEYRLSAVEERLNELLDAETRRADAMHEHARAFLINSVAGPVIVGAIMLVVQHLWH
jgi:hypothetical protein